MNCLQDEQRWQLYMYPPKDLAILLHNNLNTLRNSLEDYAIAILVGYRSASQRFKAGDL